MQVYFNLSFKFKLDKIRANTTVIANALDELEYMQNYVEQISCQINDNNNDIQVKEIIELSNFNVS